jgi:predicted GH43/DUF377 family glycosyl hydrolase
MICVRKSDENPVLIPKSENTWEAEGAFNGCPVVHNNRIHLLYRAQSSPQQVDGKLMELSSIGQAASADGVHFGEHSQFIRPEYEWEKYGCEDPRVTRLDDKYYIFYTALSTHPFGPDGIRVGLAISRDLETIDSKHAVTPFNAKAMALFPEKIGGKMVAILTANTDRPPARIGLAYFDSEEQMWSQEYWENWHETLSEHTLALQRSPADHIEVGAPPIKTPRGWLLVYSYIENYAYPPAKFGVQAVLLDLEDPSKIIAHTEDPLLVPAEEYERYGKVPNIVFPSGVMEKDGQLHIYYGAADTVTAVATCEMDRLLDEMCSAKPQVIRLRRFSFNPILRPKPDHPWESLAVFNPAAIEAEGKVHMLYRAMSEDNTSTIGYAASEDGMHFSERHDEPVYVPREDFEMKKVPGGNSGCEDPRLTRIGDTVYMLYTAYDGRSVPRVALTSIGINDFVSHRWSWSLPKLISAPNEGNKDAALFPRKVGGKYAILHRIEPHIWIDFVDDLEFAEQKWLGGSVLMTPRAGARDSKKIGIAGPPIETEHGWLLLYHGISKKADRHYHVRAALLDRDDPTKVLARTRDPILETLMPYEREGIVKNVVFPCGHALLDDVLFVYYGAADTVIGGATILFSEMMNKLVRE